MFRVSQAKVVRAKRNAPVVFPDLPALPPTSSGRPYLPHEGQEEERGVNAMSEKEVPAEPPQRRVADRI